MDSEAFREWGKKMVDFVADHWDHIRDRTPLPTVKPGYLQEVVPAHPPEHPEQWQNVFDDLEKVVMQGNTYWQHPHFFAYYPTSISYSSIIADILSGGLAGIGFSWKSSPAMTELEMATMDWLVDALELPQHFRNSHEGPGCGVIQNTASDATLIAILAARGRAVEYVKEHSLSNWVMQSDVGQKLKGLLEKMKPSETEDPYLHPYHDPSVFDKFVAYCSDQGHSSIDKGAMLAGVRLRKLRSTRDKILDNYTVLPQTLEDAIKEDRARGLYPFIMIATIGTTNTCGVDSITDLGPICNREKIWLHVDAAYAGNFLLCPEFRYMSKGMELVDSFNYNAHKAMHINFDCSPMWFKDGSGAVKYFNVDPIYLRHEYQTTAADYRHFQIALGRRFRSLKVWFVLRTIGIEKIQKYLRNTTLFAEIFKDLVQADPLFELFVPRHLGLVCFKLANASNSENEELCNLINNDGRIHLVPSKVHNDFFLRFVVCSQLTTHDDVIYAFNVIKELAQKMLQK